MSDPPDPLRWWANVVIPGGSLAPGRGPAGAERYLAFPRRERPSHLIDPHLRGAVQDAVGRTGAGGSRAERIARQVAAAVAGIDRIRQNLPNSVHVVAAPDAVNLRAMLSERLGRPVRLSITAGPVRPNRKPVVRVFDPDERLVAFAKVGWDAATAALIATEADALGLLLSDPCPGIIAPEPIWSGDWHGHHVLLTRPLAVDHRVATDRAPDVEVGSLRLLAEHFPQTSSPLAESAYWQRLSRRLADAPDGSSLLVAIADAVGSDPMLFGAFHGDWSPWNLRRTPDRQQLFVWDWERFATDAPVGLDAAHHHMQVHRFLRKQTVADAVEPVRAALRTDLPRLGVDPEAAAAVVMLELLEALARMTESGLAGQLAAPRAELVDALRSELAAPRGRVS
ncbi:MAG: hypothetical protein HKN26_16085 [Acidimicrobiales bacterium]|nr:hypothetical protein [Acidimicrobiales bacterium]